MFDDKSIRGQPDRALLNRHESYEVEYFAQRFARKQPLAPVEETVAKVKRLLPLVPSDLRSQEHIEDWLTVNWNSYK